MTVDTYNNSSDGSYELYRNLVEHSLQGLLIFQEQRIVFANSVVTDISGYTPEELYAWSPDEIASQIHPEDREQALRYMRNRLSGEPAPSRHEFRLYHKDGSIRWIEAYATRIDYQGKPASQVVELDVTERKEAEARLIQAYEELESRVAERTDRLSRINRALHAEIAEHRQTEQRLRASEEKYRMLFENERDAISLVDTLTGQFLDVNTAWEHLYGYTREETRTMRAFDVSEEPAATIQAAELAQAHGGGIHIPVRWHRRKDGSIFAVELSLSLFTWEGRNVTCVIARDITERRQMEENIAHKSALLEAALENMDQGILMADDNWNIVAYNQRLLAMFDFPDDFFQQYPDLESVLRQWVGRGGFGEEMQERALQDARRSDVFSFEIPGPLHNQMFEIRHSPFPGGGLVRTYTDITERKRNEEALQQANEQLAQYIHELEQRNHDMRVLYNRLQDELNLARRIQQSLLPPTNPDWTGLDVACYNIPAREVGGDLYVYHAFSLPTDDTPMGKYALAVGDVSGKGMPAALLMAVSLASFHSVIGQGLAPGAVLAYLDDALVHYTQTTRQNCAMVYLEIVSEIQPARAVEVGMQQQTSMVLPPAAASLRVANAGCIAPIIKRHDGSVFWLDVGGMPLGVGIGSTFGYEETTLDVSSGDQIILLSDGVIEAMNRTGIMFGFERMEATVHAGPQTNAQDMLTHLRAEVEAFVQSTDLHDDVTLVVIQV